MNELPIGIFDSGVGGLTVMRAIADALPDEDLVYLGDTARVPYGNRSPATIRRYAINATEMLTGEGVKALVVACNTASAHGLSALRDRHELPIIGVIEPVAQKAAQTTKSGAVGVIGTRGTVASGSYRAELERLGVRRIVEQPCPLFVPLAEEGWTDGPVVEEIARTYLETFRGTDVDTLILGCTHYPILALTIRRVFEEITGGDVEVLDSATATAAVLTRWLDAEGLRAQTSGRSLRFCATDDPDRFKETASRFFGAELTDVAHVDIRDISTSTP